MSPLARRVVSTRCRRRFLHPIPQQIKLCTFKHASAFFSVNALVVNGHAAWQHGIGIQNLAGVSVTLCDALGGTLADNFLRVSA